MNTTGRSVLRQRGTVDLTPSTGTRAASKRARPASKRTRAAPLPPAAPPAANARQLRAVENACRRITAGDAPQDLDALASAAGMSRFHFHRLFRQVTGVTPKAFADAQRVQRAREALAGGARVTDTIHDAGFGSHSRFYAAAMRDLGMRPRAYQARGLGSVIRFAVAQCSLGALLVASSDRGVCAILLGDDPEALVRDVQDRFANAELVGADRAFERQVAQVIAFVEAPHVGLDLPLDLRGTAFQQRVWQALRRIPPGETLSYAELARRIGQPTATRAVAQACGANAIAIAVPCHRVIRNDGSISGYRWGVARKRALLERERQPKSKSMPSGTGTS